MKKVLSLVLVFALTAGMLVGCEGISENFENQDTIETANLNETISHDSKWINSSIEGAIDENSKINLKDDFYSAINREWLLETHADKAHPQIEANKSDEITSLRLLGIMKGEVDPEAQGDAPVPEEYVKYDEELVRSFTDALMDWDSRNASGVSNLKKYTDYIEAIDTVEELREYFIGNNGQNLQQLGLVTFNVSSARLDAENYYVYVTDTFDSAISGSAYSNEAIAGNTIKNMDEQCGYILRKLGYSDSEVKDIFRRCYKFEAGLTDHQLSQIYYSGKFIESEDSLKTSGLDEIKAIEGNYPLIEVIKAYGYEEGRIVVPNQKYIEYVGKQINENNLENIKAYLLVNTVANTRSILDRETYDYFEALRERDTKITEADYEGDAISKMDRYYLNMVQSYMQGALDTVYVARYCTQEKKEDLTELTYAYINKYHEIFSAEEWLSDETKEYANEKLDAIVVNVLYPDEFTSYDYISINKDDNLIDMIADINADKRGSDAGLIMKPVNRGRWDMDEPMHNTTYFNAFYDPTVNSINILDGYFADPVQYRIDMSPEEKLAKVGAVIGHEITHGFDINGSKFDKNGFKRNWWQSNDKSKFDALNQATLTIYMALSPYPGNSYGAINSSNVEGEVAADLGGIRCSLEIGKDLENFDNKAFFEYFTKGYREKVTLTGAKGYDGNEHPICYIRTNVDVMQFEEFQEAFDIKEGDGMYIAPEKMIKIW